MEISFYEDPSIAFTVGNLLGQCAIEAGSGEKDGSTPSKEDDIKQKAEYPLTDCRVFSDTHYLPSSE